ncbi:unnamed protein product [Ectocarpus sp. 8 AP-2014]
MRQSTSTQQSPRPTQQSPRPNARRPTSSSQVGGRTSLGGKTARGASARSSMPSARAVGPPPTVSSDVFEIVADGNADVLEDMIAFSGAQHMCELRSKNKEDYGRNLLHCAVASGQRPTLQVLLKHEAFDANQASPKEDNHVYTRSTPLMEAVKIGRLDLIECLVAAGARLDVQQDVNGDTVLHWAAREVSAAFLRQVLNLARTHGRTAQQMLAALQLKNNSGENAADVGANDVARESIRRLVSGEEAPGLPPKKHNSSSVRASQSGIKSNGRASYAAAPEAGGGGGLRPSQSGPVGSSSAGLRLSQSGHTTGSRPSQSGTPPGARLSQSAGRNPETRNSQHQHHSQSQATKRNHRPGSAATSSTPQPAPLTRHSSPGTPPGVVLGALTGGGGSTAPTPGGGMAVAMAQGGAAAVVGEGVARGQEGQPTKPLLLPKVKGVVKSYVAIVGAADAKKNEEGMVRVRASSTPTSPTAHVQETPG